MARLTLCHFHERKNRQLENPSRKVPENKLSREIRVILDLVLILFTTSANTREPSYKVFSVLLSLRPTRAGPRKTKGEYAEKKEAKTKFVAGFERGRPTTCKKDIPASSVLFVSRVFLSRVGVFHVPSCVSS